MLVVLLLFGGKKLPELARGLGKGIREFKDASDGVKREIHRNINAVNEEMDFENTGTSKTYTSSYAASDYPDYQDDDYRSAEDFVSNPDEPADNTKPADKKADAGDPLNKTPENN